MFVDAAAYDRYMGRWSALLAPAFLDAVTGPDDDPPTSVLDVGCGTGNLAAAVLDRWPAARVVGVDPSPGFVAAAAERLPADRARVRVGSALDLPEPDGSVDAALALLVLNFVPDPAAATAEMRRVTRPGGLVAAAVWDYGGGMTMLRTFWDAAAAVDPSSRTADEVLAAPARAGGLTALLGGAGLVDVAEGLTEVPMRFESFADYWDPFLLGIGPAGDHVARLDDAAREALRAELHRRLGDGPIEMTATARSARGRVPA